MAALLSTEIGDTDKVVQYINEARELGIDVLPPDVNESGFKFTVVGDKRIRFGLGAVRNVGAGAIESIIAARRGGPFRSLVRLRRADRPAALQQAGARVADRRRRLRCASAIGPSWWRRSIRRSARRSCCSRRSRPGQASLFGEAIAAAPVEHPLPDVPPWTEAERLAKEKEVIGFFISGHPLERFRAEVELFGTRTTATLGEWDERPVAIAAVVTAVKRQISKKTGKEYARITLEDFHGTAEAIVFPEAWAKLNQVIRADARDAAHRRLLAAGPRARSRRRSSSRRRATSAEMEDVGCARRGDPLGRPVAAGRRRPCWRSPGSARPTPGRRRSILIGPTATADRPGSGRAGCGSAPEESTLRALRDLFGGDAVSLIRAE